MSRRSGTNGYLEANAQPALPHLTPAARPGRFVLSRSVGGFPPGRSPTIRVAGPDLAAGSEVASEVAPGER
jgi:hypothetical protein